jgi:hypothetical protein
MAYSNWIFYSSSYHHISVYLCPLTPIYLSKWNNFALIWYSKLSLYLYIKVFIIDLIQKTYLFLTNSESLSKCRTSKSYMYGISYEMNVNSFKILPCNIIFKKIADISRIDILSISDFMYSLSMIIVRLITRFFLSLLIVNVIFSIYYDDLP